MPSPLIECIMHGVLSEGAMLLTSFLRSLSPTSAHGRRELRDLTADWGGIICLLMSAYVTLCMLWYLFPWGGSRYTLVFNDILIFPTVLGTVLLTWRASTHPVLDAYTRRAWQLLALGVLCFTGGALLWFWYEIILGTTRFPSWADACFLLAYPAFYGGLVRFPVAQRSRNERWKNWLDAAMVLVASSMVLWLSVIMPVAVTSTGTLTMLLALAYPAGDLLLLFGITAVVLRRPDPRSILSLHLLVIAFTLYFIGDLGFTTRSLQGTFENGSWIDACWMATIWLIGLSAHIQHRQATASAHATTESSSQWKPTSTLPYLAVVLGNALLLFAERDRLLTSPGLIVVAVVLLSILVVLRQITAVRENMRLLAEQSVLQSQARFQSLVQHASDLITVIEPDGTISYQSPSSERVLGYQAQSLLGSNFFALVDPQDHPALQGVLANMHSPTLELQLRHQDGAWRHVEVVSTNLLADVTVRGVVLNGRDITERKRAEAAQHRSEERFQLAAQATNDALWDFDLSTMQGWWSTAYTTTFGLPSGDIPPGTWEEHLHPEDRERAVSSVESMAAADLASWSAEYRLRRGNGTYANVIDRGYLVRDKHGTPTRMLGTVTDVTRRTQEEEALRHAKDEAEHANRAKSAFLATMSHEIRTPLNGVLGMTDLLLGTPLTAEQHEYAAIIRESGGALLQLINDILDFSKIEAEKIVIEQEPFSPRQLIDTIAHVLVAQAREKRIELLTYVAPDVPQVVRGDAGRLRQILINLVGNAVKFTESGEVSLHVAVEHASEGQVMLRYAVRDTGIGLTQPQIARLFQPFTQADGSMTRRYGGTGLGLAVSKRLVDLMGGSIEVASVIGQGSTFTCLVPHAPVESPASEIYLDQFARATAGHEAATNRSTHTPDATPNKGPMILVAEDNLVNQKLVLMQLKKLGYQAQAVATGRAAVEAVAEGSYSLVLMDCQMPEMDGLEATRVLRMDPAGQGRIPIIALTANAMQGDREACLSAGMDDYLSKPLKVEALRAVIARWLP
jgi:PAS domain S-box-containing protein